MLVREEDLLLRGRIISRIKRIFFPNLFFFGNANKMRSTVMYAKASAVLINRAELGGE